MLYAQASCSKLKKDFFNEKPQLLYAEARMWIKVDYGTNGGDRGP
jgi:hypothetical protein